MECLKYPTINQNPISHFTHLFFVNGNGTEFIDGNPQTLVYSKYLPWLDYYNEGKPFQVLYDYEKYYNIPLQISQYIKNRNETTKNLIDEDIKKLINADTYKTLYNAEIEKLDNIVELTMDDLQNTDFWIECLKRKDQYFPYLNLSNGYFKLQNINGHTENNLFEIAKAVTLAYLAFFADITKDEMISDYKDVLIGTGWSKDHIKWIWEQSREDYDTLRQEYLRLEKI